MFVNTPKYRFCDAQLDFTFMIMTMRHSLTETVSKGVFFSESAMCFLDLQISKEIFQKTILSLKFKFPAICCLLLLAGNLNYKLRIVFWNISFWRFGDLKNESHFVKKGHL